MKKSVYLYRHLAALFIPLGLFSALIFLIRSPLFLGNTLTLGLTIDLLITIPLIYFLLIRKSNIPMTTVVPVMILGLFIGSYFLPSNKQVYLNIFKTWVLPIIELLVVTFIILKVKKGINRFKDVKGSTDFFSTLKETCSEILPKKLVVPFATEIAVFYYGFINWKLKPLKANEFSYHKKTGTISLLIALILIIAIETVTLHFFIEKWNNIAAWVLTFLSVYSGLQFFGIARSFSKRPITISADSLLLKYGIMNEAQIPFTNIESIELSKEELKKDKLIKKLSPLGELEEHNIIISLKMPNTLRGLYGIKRKFTTIAFFVDEPNKFIEHLELALQNTTEINN